MAASDHYLLTLRAHALTSGSAIQNAFVYLQQEGTGNAARLNVAFVAAIVGAILAVSSDQYVIDDVLTINLDDLDDYDTETIADAGESSGQHLPIYNTWYFEYTRTTRAIQNGRKAIGIISEPDSENGNATTTALVLLNNLANALAGELDDPVTVSSWRPQLWRRPGTYSSGVVSAPGLFYDVDDVLYRKISTQNTRKIGRGA